MQTAGFCLVTDLRTVRVISRNPGIRRTLYDWRHYLSVLQRKPGALRNGAPFTEMPASLKQLQAILIKRPGGDREMVEILTLVLQHEESACSPSLHSSSA